MASSTQVSAICKIRLEWEEVSNVDLGLAWGGCMGQRWGMGESTIGWASRRGAGWG